MKFVPLSEYMSVGLPRRLTNRFNVAMNPYVVKLLTTSKCTVLVVMHRNSAKYDLVVVRTTCTNPNRFSCYWYSKVNTYSAKHRCHGYTRSGNISHYLLTQRLLDTDTEYTVVYDPFDSTATINYQSTNTFAVILT